MILELQVEMWKQWFRLNETIVFTVGVGPQTLQNPLKKHFKNIYKNNTEKTQKIPKIVKGTPGEPKGR